jgi:hypothetical protein
LTIDIAPVKIVAQLISDRPYQYRERRGTIDRFVSSLRVLDHD